MTPLSRLRNAVASGQPVMFDVYEAGELWRAIVDLQDELREAKREYDELLHKAACASREMVGGLLSATLAGAIRNAKENP
jgi:hypothetical protein